LVCVLAAWWSVCRDLGGGDAGGGFVDDGLAPLHPYTRGLIGAVPSPDHAERLTGIGGQQPRPGRRGPGCSFAARCGFAVDECRTRTPEPVLVDHRAVRCLRVSQIGAGQAARPARAAGLMAGESPAVLSVLSVRDVSAKYGQTPVLAGIRLDVPPESCVAVVGESGAGKTTLARCIAGQILTARPIPTPSA
jgi:peptide/nickel transport system ATP-binding protein